MIVYFLYVFSLKVILWSIFSDFVNEMFYGVGFFICDVIFVFERF